MARILCLHGLGGTGATMWPLVGALGADGHEVLAPTLPGHGERPEALHDVTWEDWLTAAAAWPADVVIGQSMGGSLALALAAAGQAGRPGKAAHPGRVVAINALAPDPDAVDGLEWQASRGVAWVDAPPLGDGEIGYERLPIGALLAMARGIAAIDLAAVGQPVLVVRGERDDVLDPGHADVIAAALPGPAERLSLPRSGHVATLGPDLDVLLAAIRRFVATSR